MTYDNMEDYWFWSWVLAYPEDDDCGWCIVAHIMLIESLLLAGAIAIWLAWFPL